MYIRNEDTICAPATVPGTGAISVIRVSGPEALTIADKVITCRKGSIAEAGGYTLKFGFIYDSANNCSSEDFETSPKVEDCSKNGANGQVIDEVLVSIFRAPHSYTGENSVEISCHASSYIVSAVMDLLYSAGCRAAEPGEFTQRAFLNGKMDLAQAEAVADDPLEDSYLEKIILLRHAVSYSLKRHWTHSWIIIGGVFLSIFVLATCNSDNQSAVSRAEGRLYTVEHWEEADTVFESYPAEIRYFNDIKNPKYAKSDLLCRQYESYLRHTENAERDRQSADTATVKSVKKDFLNSAKKEEELAKKSLKQYNKVNKMDFKGKCVHYVDKIEDEVDAAEGNAFFLWFLLVVFLIMTPLYIMASYQYGHVIIKHQKEASILEKVKKTGFSIAAGLFGAGLAMQFFPSTTVKTYWSDGSTSTHTEENVFNYIIIALKVGLFILAVLVVCFVSCFLMTYMTITGLYRNYNWPVIYNDIKTRLKSLKK